MVLAAKSFSQKVGGQKRAGTLYSKDVVRVEVGGVSMSNDLLRVCARKRRPQFTVTWQKNGSLGIQASSTAFSDALLIVKVPMHPITPVFR